VPKAKTRETRKKSALGEEIKTIKNEGGEESEKGGVLIQKDKLYATAKCDLGS